MMEALGCLWLPTGEASGGTVRGPLQEQEIHRFTTVWDGKDVAEGKRQALMSRPEAKFPFCSTTFAKNRRRVTAGENAH